MNNMDQSPLESVPKRNSLFTRKTYETEAEKKRDFWIGVGLFFGLNILLTACQWGLGAGLITITSNFDSSIPDSSPLASIFAIFFYAMPWVINVGLLIYFAFTRSQIALGMLAGFGIALLLVICLGVIFTAVCFLIIAGSTGY